MVREWLMERGGERDRERQRGGDREKVMGRGEERERERETSDTITLISLTVNDES